MPDQNQTDIDAAEVAAAEQAAADAAAAVTTAAVKLAADQAADAAKKKTAKKPAVSTKKDGKQMPDELPDSVTLAAQYGYYDDMGNMHMWQAGQVVTNTDEIEDLFERDAPLADIDVA